MTKKLLLPLLILSFFYGLGHLHKNNITPSVQEDGAVFNRIFPLPKKNSDTVSTAKGTTVGAASENEAQILESGSGGILFAYLFDGQFQKHGQINGQTLQAVTSRFEKPYSEEVYGHFSVANKEASDRLGILKAWGLKTSSLTDPRLKQEVISFYESVLENKKENILVRRQALKSLVRTEKPQSETEYLKNVAKRDRHLMALASMSDEQMIEALLEK